MATKSSAAFKNQLAAAVLPLRLTEGWPEGSTMEEREIVVEGVRTLLCVEGQLLSTHDLTQAVKRTTRWKPGALWDYQYAMVERAATYVGGDKVWRAGA